MTFRNPNYIITQNYDKLRDRIEAEERDGEDTNARDEFEKLDYELGSREMGFADDCDPSLANMTTELLQARCNELAKILNMLPL